MTEVAKRASIALTRTTDPSGLFATEADMRGIDVQASMEEYDRLLHSAVARAIPEATVRITDRGRISTSVTSEHENPENTRDAHEYGLLVQDIADRVLESGDWIVEL